MEVTIMSYNIEHMNRMFSGGHVAPAHDARAKKIAQVIQGINPHILGISEAASDASEHRNFIAKYLPGSGYDVAAGAGRGAQNLVFWFRPPVSLISVDDMVSFYGDWQDDIDRDGLKEALHWERKPLEAVFKVGDAGSLRAILVHAKSKGVFSVVDLHDFEAIAQGNRKKLIGQATRLRQRVDLHLSQAPTTPLLILGDMNDGPGQDAYEMKLGKSFVETVTGNVFEPESCLHHPLYFLSKDPATRADLWTVEFPDPIVENALGYKHRVWLDHILLSPHFLKPDSPLRLVPDSGRIAEKNPISKAASDHFAVYCRIIAGDAPAPQRATTAS